MNTFWRALAGMKHSLGFQFAVGGSLFVSLTLVALGYLATENIDKLTAQWGRGLSLVVYLKDEVTPSDGNALVRKLAARDEVNVARYVSAKEALNKLREGLGQRRDVLAGLANSHLPGSIEVSLKHQTSQKATATLIGSIQSLNTVEEVDHLGVWAQKLEALSQRVNTVFWIAALAIALIGFYFVRQSARLCLAARRNEIEVQRMLGASDRFIILPFVVEGAMQGLVASIAAASASFLVFRYLANGAEEALSAIISYQTLLFFSPMQLAYGIGIGTATGIVANHFSVMSRLKDLSRIGVESNT
jgi:cell division transport system permease protein